MSENTIRKTLRRATVRALAALAFLPAIANAAAILELRAGDLAVAGWSNSAGEFLVTYAAPAIAMHGTGNYSQATSLFSYATSTNNIFLAAGHVDGPGTANILINVFVENNRTDAGHLLGGTFIMKAGPDGFASLGAAAGDLLLTGYAIDAAALDKSQHGVNLLFALTYKIPSLVEFGDYATYNLFATLFTHPNGTPTPTYAPWQGEWSASGFTDSIYSTKKIPEPSGLLLTAFGIAMLATFTVKRSPKKG